MKSRIFLRTLGEQPAPDEWADPRARLRNALNGFRKRAAVLAGEIHRDLPDFTVHDITHIDALWEMAELLAGPDYPLNPLEAFVLGGVFLLHDLGLGLAAWPEGVDKIKQDLRWQDALSGHLRKHLGRAPTAEEMASPPSEVERAAIQDRLRALHAEHAERLANAEFQDPRGGARYYLIDDPDLRQALGPLLGRIAHSHWWPVSRLGSEFGTPIGAALPDCPPEWRIDPLKIAVLLRTADAAHLDARRAPGFLRALRRPEAFSREHWVFQEHLNKPYLEADRLVFTARAFSPEETDAWWLCLETLRMVDGELHQCDALLADFNRPRLEARGVARIESTERLQKYIPASGWTPVDARIHVSNVADLAKRLGGEQLYGNEPTVPLRELIQNASDAVRARRLLQDWPKDWGKILVRLGEDESGPWLEVEDTGIGMSEAVLSGPLLDFGTTYWGSALMREEHEGLWAKGFEPTGHFGIGFFSVFMWGHRVRVISRPYRDGQSATRVLEFRTGIEARPIVRPARPEEQLRDGGTRVRVWLNRKLKEKGGMLAQKELGQLCAWLAPALDVDLCVQNEDGNRRVVAASDWLTMAGDELILRLSSGEYGEREGMDYAPLLRVLHDSEGRIVGRAAICDHFVIPAVVSVGGLRSSLVHGTTGILLGATDRVTRDEAAPLADASALQAWASEQASLIAKAIRDPEQLMNCAVSVISYGGDPGLLPIAIQGDDLVNFETLSRWADPPNEVALFMVSYDEIVDEEIRLHPHVLGTSSLGFSFQHELSRTVSKWIAKALAQAWGCDYGQVEVSKSQGYYEIGSKEGKPKEEWNIPLIRRPAGQRK